VTATISLGSASNGVAVNPKTNIIYVTTTAFPANPTVSLISARTNTVTATIPANGEAFGVAVNTKTNRAYTADAASDAVSVLTRCPK